MRIAPLFSAPENGANHTQISLIAITDQILLLVHILQKSQIFFPVLRRAFSTYVHPSYLVYFLLTHLVGHFMRKLALSQADGSQAGTEPEFDPIVHRLSVTDTTTAPSPPTVPSMALVHAETVESQVFPSDFGGVDQEVTSEHPQGYTEGFCPTDPQSGPKFSQL